MDSRAWDEAMQTGDQIVDEQHRAIRCLVDDAEAAADDPAQLLRVLDRLMEHVDCHFATEEALMVQTRYQGPEAEAHIDEHRALTNEARDVVMQVRLGQVTSMAPVAEFLRDWLTKHVDGRDRAFISHVRSRNAAATLPEPWASCPPDAQVER